MNSQFDVKEVQADLKDKGVKYCLGAYVDIHGIPKGKFVPIDHLTHMVEGSELYTGYALDGLGQKPNQEAADTRYYNRMDSASQQTLQADTTKAGAIGGLWNSAGSALSVGMGAYGQSLGASQIPSAGASVPAGGVVSPNQTMTYNTTTGGAPLAQFHLF